jgi:RNA polymerase sigma-70 factor (ECF subfamily)
MISTASKLTEHEVLAAAQGGDEDAFRLLVEPPRVPLHAHCYRMLGSLHDAEDALQEALLRAWRGLPAFDRRSTLRRWLYRIATNACLDALARRRKRVLPIDHQPDLAANEPGGPLWLEPYPDEALGVEDGFAAPEARYEQREAVELAFVAALQHLPPRQRAVLILREVLGFSAKEVSESLETSVASVNSALQRARATLEAHQLTAAETTPSVETADAELLARYVEAFEHYDMDALTSLIHEDATQSMPPYDLWLAGRDDILTWWFGPGNTCRDSRVIPTTSANGAPAFGQYRPVPGGEGYEPWALQVLEIENGKIVELTFFLDTARVFPLFGLPLEYPG